jgi:hypothetical protein
MRTGSSTRELNIIKIHGPPGVLMNDDLCGTDDGARGFAR